MEEFNSESDVTSMMGGDTGMAREDGATKSDMGADTDTEEEEA